MPLTRAFVEELAALLELHERVLGGAAGPLGNVFRSPGGCALATQTVNAMRLLDRLLAAAGIERVDAHGRKLDIHALRHTAATRLARAGVPLLQTQRILGHSDPKLTARVYSHLEVEDLRESVELAPAQGAPRRPRLVPSERRADDPAEESA